MSGTAGSAGVGYGATESGNATGGDGGEGRGIPNVGLPLLVVTLAGLLILTRARADDDE